MSSSMQIQVPDGSFGGYLALPAQTPAPGVVVLQEIFGVNQVMRDTCDWLAENGFAAFCPDLFWRIEPGIDLTDQNDADLKRAFELFGLFDVETGMTDIAASLTALRQHPACAGKAGTIGYCLGGRLAYLASTRTDTEASVSYYGVAIKDSLDEARNIKTPLMLHIAGQDEFVPPEDQKTVISALQSNPLVTIYTYPDCHHAFARPGGAHYDAEAAKLANARSLSFLHAALDG